MPASWRPSISDVAPSISEIESKRAQQQPDLPHDGQGSSPHLELEACRLGAGRQDTLPFQDDCRTLTLRCSTGMKASKRQALIRVQKRHSSVFVRVD